MSSVFGKRSDRMEAHYSFVDIYGTPILFSVQALGCLFTFTSALRVHINFGLLLQKVIVFEH